MKKVRILSIDGGGIRGILPAVILEYIENELKAKSGNSDAVIQDYFDMIAGTSTGGILTCFYLHPSRLPAGKAVELYVKNGKNIFNPKVPVPVVKGTVKLFSPAYSSKGLETALNETLGDTKLSELSKHSLVTAYDIVARKSVFFTVPQAKAKPDKDFYLKDIARATSAAPTYFEPASIKSMDNEKVHHLIDGAMFANDPSLCALVEARKNKYEACNHPTIKDVYLVSIGTGKKPEALNTKKAANWGKFNWAKPALDIFMSASSEVVNYQLNQLFEVSGCPECYERIEPSRDKACHKMDNVSQNNIKLLREAGKKHLEIEKEKIQLDRIVKYLLENN